jgi:hypothetical protein
MCGTLSVDLRSGLVRLWRKWMWGKVASVIDAGIGRSCASKSINMEAPYVIRVLPRLTQ